MLTLLLESVTTAPPAGAIPVSVTVPVEEKPQFPLDGEMTSEESAGAVVADGFTVNCALAELWLHTALAETVTDCCVLTVLGKEVVIVTDALLAPTGTVREPVHAGVPAQPGKVATWVFEGLPSLTRTDTVELSLVRTTRLRVTVAVSDAPAVTVAGVSVTDWMLSEGGVMVTLCVCGVPTPVVALTVAVRGKGGLLVAVRVPEVLLAVHPASMTKLPSVTNALGSLLVTVTCTPPTGAGVEAESVPWVKALLPPGIVEMGFPAPSVMLNERSGGTIGVPPGVRVSDEGTETRVRPLPVFASV